MRRATRAKDFRLHAAAENKPKMQQKWGRKNSPADSPAACMVSPSASSSTGAPVHIGDFVAYRVTPLVLHLVVCPVYVWHIAQTPHCYVTWPIFCNAERGSAPKLQFSPILSLCAVHGQRLNCAHNTISTTTGTTAWVYLLPRHS